MVVHDFVSQILDLDPQAHIVVMGDLNDFQFSEPLADLKGDLLVDLIERVDPAEAYTYLYEGNSQALDHILVNKNAPSNVAWTADVVHVNAEFADQASDHDPVVVGLNFDAVPCPGDFNNDRIVGPPDYRSFSECMRGPDVPVDPGCLRADADADGDADFTDFRDLEAGFGGVCPEGD